MSRSPERSAFPVSGSRMPPSVRSGFEPYVPGARGAAAAGNDSGQTGPFAKGGGAVPLADGHDLGRGRSLWEDDRQEGRLRSDEAWTHDKWADHVDEQPRGHGRSGRGTTTAGRVGAQSPRGSAARRRHGFSGSRSHRGAAPATAQEPSGEQYEDISRRVEDEVVAKLARAQMMGMMLRAHREQEHAQAEHRWRAERRPERRPKLHSRRRRGGEEDIGLEGGGGGGGDYRRGSGGRGPVSPARHGQLARKPRGKGKGVEAVVTQRSAAAPSSRGARNHDRRQRRDEQPPDESASGDSVHTPERDVDDAQGDPTPTHPGEDSLHGASVSPRSKSARPAGLLRVAHDKLVLHAPASVAAAEPEDLGADPETMEAGEVYVVVGKLEQQYKTLLEERRLQLQVGVRPGRGPAHGEGMSAADAVAAAAAVSRSGGKSEASLLGKLTRVRTALCLALGSLVRRDPVLSLRKRLPNRFWMAYYREMEMVQQRLRHIGGVDAAQVSLHDNQQQREASNLRDRLFVLIENAEHDITAMVEALQFQLSTSSGPGSSGGNSASGKITGGAAGNSLSTRESDHDCAASGSARGEDPDTDACSDDSEEEDKSVTDEDLGRRQALQAFLTNLGDLARYRGLHAAQQEMENEGSAWDHAEALYQDALRINPDSGKVNAST